MLPLAFMPRCKHRMQVGTHEYSLHVGGLVMAAFVRHAWALVHVVSDNGSMAVHEVDWPEETLHFLALFCAL